VTSEGWRIENAEWLTCLLRRLRLRLELHALSLQRPGGEPRAVDWLVAGEPDLGPRAVDGPAADAHAAAMDALDVELGERGGRMAAAGRPPALTALSESVGLSAFERELLLLAAAPALDGGFARAFAELHADGRRDHATLQLALALFVEDPVERVLFADCLLPGNTLRRLRLVDMLEDPVLPPPLRQLAVDDRMVDFLRGVNRVDTRVMQLLSPLPPALPGAQTRRDGAEVARLVAAESERWTTVNLIGTVEGGAGDVAQHACAELGVALHKIDLTRLAAATVADRHSLSDLLGREAALTGAAIFVDASELERASADATLVDELIEGLPATLFVVSDERWPAGHRAAAFRLTRPDRAEQRLLWGAALSGFRHSLNGEVDAIVQQFDLGPQAIADVVARASALGGNEITGSDLWRECRDQAGLAFDEFAKRIEPCYRWDDIVVDDDVRAQLRELAGQVQGRSRVYEAWGFGAKLSRGRGITALFSGPSGTGKTMAAEILAAHLELDLYRIDLAGVVSKYVGETEKNLRRVFAGAERSGAVLLFDEADALFGTRTEVRDSHDRYANVEVNYLLQRMEDYAGLAVLATNRRNALDPAFLRRLRFVVEFSFPGPEHRRAIWEKVFPPQADLGDLDYAFLAGLELTGGNIRSIAVNAAFLAASERTSISMPHLARAAAREYAKLSRPISAAEFGVYHEAARA